MALWNSRCKIYLTDWFIKHMNKYKGNLSILFTSIILPIWSVCGVGFMSNIRNNFDAIPFFFRNLTYLFQISLNLDAQYNVLQLYPDIRVKKHN